MVMLIIYVHLHLLLLLVDETFENRSAREMVQVCVDCLCLCNHFGEDIGKAVFCNCGSVVL